MEFIEVESFAEQVLRSDVPVLVTFRAKWCESSQQVAGLIDESLATREGVRVVGVDLGDDDPRNNKVCQRYKINRLPAVLLINEGRVKDLMGGVPSADDLNDMVDRQLKPVMDVGEHNFRQEVLESKVPVLVHFHSAACQQSEALVTAVDTLAERFQGRARIVRVEADPFNAALCARYGAVRFPMVGAFQDGEMRDYILGAGGDEEEFTVEDGSRRRRDDYVAEMLEHLC